MSKFESDQKREVKSEVMVLRYKVGESIELNLLFTDFKLKLNQWENGTKLV